MKSSLLAILIGLVLGYGIMQFLDKMYDRVRLSGCVDAVIADVERRYGPLPPQLRDKVLPQVKDQCKQALEQQ